MPLPGLPTPFPGDGEMAERYRTFAWEGSPMGPPAQWPTALRTVVRTVLETAVPMGIWCGPDRTLLYNDAFAGVLGNRHPVAFGAHGSDAHDVLWNELGQHVALAMSGEGTRSGHHSLSPVRDDAGRVLAVLHVATLQAAVTESPAPLGMASERQPDDDANYRMLASAIPVHVWTAKPDGQLDFVSERTKMGLGMGEDEILGEAWIGAVHPDDVERSSARWAQSVQTGDTYEIEFRVWSAQHRTHRWHLVRATPQRDDTGAIVRWFGTNTDIHDAKSAQSELQRLTATAEDANRSKSDFLAAMSHELRTPLNAIGGYAQLLELGVRGPVNDEQKADLRRIQRSKAHLDGLVSGVLDFAKLGAGNIELRIVSVDVDQIIASALDMVRPQLSEKGLRLTYVQVPSALRLQADIEKTRQILLNLLANALKFTPGGGAVHVDVDTDGERVRIGVADTGIGIAPSDQLRVFEPFVQATSALHVAGIGVGLGLAISRQLARAMGGDVTVTSMLGQGSTFTLSLPSSG